MKTWDQAFKIHKSRLVWCARLGETMQVLKALGAPPPDDVCSAHADWASVHGIIRVGMTLDSAVNFTASHDLLKRLGFTFRDPTLRATTPAELNAHAPRWAALINEYARPLGHEAVMSSSARAPLHETYPLETTESAVAVRAAQDLIERRDRPYHSPGQISDGTLALRIAQRIIAAPDGSPFADIPNRPGLIEFYVRQVLAEERKAGRR